MRSAGGVKWNRALTPAEKQKLLYYRHDKQKMIKVAKSMGLKPDPSWIKAVKWWAKTF